VMDVLTAHTSKAPPAVSARRLGLPEALDAVLDRALAKSPGDRYRSCGEFTSAFQRAAGIGRNEAPAPAGGLSRPAARGVAGAERGWPDSGRDELAITRPVVPASATEPADGIESVRGRRRSGRWVTGAAAAALLAAGAGAYLALAHAGSPPAAGSGHRAAGHGAAAPRWTSYSDPSGFSVRLPPGWARTSSKPDDVQFTGPQPGFAVVVAWTDAPKPDALADWQQQAAVKAATDSSYRQISVSRASYRGYNAADWQFTDIYQGTLTRVIDRTFIVRQGQLAYAVELSGPASQWPAVYASVWQGLMNSFQPAP
jgi:eukaryotic-like serine/threonine-protein kinase